jgi:hypothetical protein
MEVKYSKAEILNRVAWANHFRIIFGSIFFVGLIIMNTLGIFLREPTVVLVLIGISILFYSLLSYYYLTTQKPSLGEVIFLSFFLGLVDVVAITVFIYFSGGADSPYFAFFLLILASKLVSTPYFQQVVFVWAAIAAACYDGLLLLLLTGLLPVYGRNAMMIGLTPAMERSIVTNMFLIPALLFIFALGVYLIGRVSRQERLELQEELDGEKELEKKIASFSQVYWTLTHVFNLDNMLSEVLDKVLEILGHGSGLIMVTDQKGGLVPKASKNVPPQLLEAFRQQNLKQLDISPANLKGIMIDDEVISNLLLKKLLFQKRPLGLLVIFCREGERCPNAKLQAALEPVVDELSAALYYGKLLRRVKAE